MTIRAALAAALAFGILALPLASDAQQATKVWRIGHLGYAYPTAARDLEAWVARRPPIQFPRYARDDSRRLSADARRSHGRSRRF